MAKEIIKFTDVIFRRLSTM